MTPAKWSWRYGLLGPGKWGVGKWLVWFTLTALAVLITLWMLDVI